MKGFFKKTLSMVLCFVMVFTMFQSTMLSASAKVVGPDNKTELTITADKSKYSWGDTIVFNIDVKNVTDEVLTGIRINSFARSYIKVVQQGDLPIIERLEPGETTTVQIEYYSTKLVGFMAFFFPILWLFNPGARIAYREAHFNYEKKVQIGVFKYRIGFEVTYNNENPSPDIPENSFSVSFNLNYAGSSNFIPTQYVKSGEKASEPTIPERENYVFVGWYTDASCEEEFRYSFNTSVQSNIVLYAKWQVGEGFIDDSLDNNGPNVEIYSFDISDRSLTVGTSKSVTFSSEIFSNIVLNTTDVAVYDDENTLIGYMNDNGESGDTTAEDGIYTLVRNLSSDTEKTVYYHVKAKDVISERLNFGFYVPISEEDSEKIKYVDSQISTLISSPEFQSATQAEKITQIKNLLQVFASSELVKDNSVSYLAANNEITFIYACGVNGAVSFDEPTDDLNAPTATTVNEKYCDKSVSAQVDNNTNTINALNEDTLNALILHGFGNSIFRRSFYRSLVNEWEDMNISTTIDYTVSVDDMRHISGYDIVVLSMHGNHAKLCVNETPTTEKDQNYSYELSVTHSVRRVTYLDGSSGYEILPRFFGDNYNSRSLNGTVVFSETCQFYGCECRGTSIDFALSNALQNLSAAAVIGYRNSVEAKYSRNVMKETITRCCNGEPISAALSAATAPTSQGGYGANDNWQDTNDDKYYSYPILRPANSNFILRSSSKIMGNIKSASNSAPIANALIRAVRSDGEIEKSTRSNSSGDYSLSLPSGEYVVTISAGSYKTAKILATVSSNRVTYLETFLLLKVGLSTGYANGKTLNAITGERLQNVSIKIRYNWNNKQGRVLSTTTSNENGYYEVRILAGLYTLECSKDGYITTYKNIIVSPYDLVQQDVSISPILQEGDYRVVLTWGKNPSDLDSHLFGSLSDGSIYHVYYSSKDGYNASQEHVANLDVDDTTSYGPETTTFTTDPNGTYEFYIDWYSGSGTWATSGGKVEVYNGSRLLGTYYVPNVENKSGSWKVFSIINGEYVSYNIIQPTDIY